jgi:hypothetical protein
VAGYRIYRNGTQIATAASTSYQDTGLTAATTYSYTVAAYDSAGNLSAQSSPVSATTLNIRGNKFIIGDRVRVTAKKLNVRATPAGKTIGSHKLNDQGIIIEGPVAVKDNVWWNINYDTYPDGWSAENWLEKISSLSTVSSLEVTTAPQPSYQPSTLPSGSSSLPSAPSEITQQPTAIQTTSSQGGLREEEIAAIQARIRDMQTLLLKLLMQLQELLQKQLQR